MMKHCLCCVVIFIFVRTLEWFYFQDLLRNKIVSFEIKDK